MEDATIDDGQLPVSTDLEQDKESAVDAGAVGEYSIVGDTRRLYVYGLNANYNSDMAIGEAWQGDDGQIYGTGICQMMLYEDLNRKMYNGSSIGLDSSPLSVFEFRLSMSPFVRTEWNIDA